jgi:phosphoserine phosphatase
MRGIQTFDVYRDLVRLCASHHQRLAVFDCDGTLIKGDIGESMLYRQLREFSVRVAPGDLWSDHPKRDDLNALYSAIVAKPIEQRTSCHEHGEFCGAILDWYFGQLREGKTEKACSDIVMLLAGFSRHELAHLAEATLSDELTRETETASLGKHVLPRGIRFINESVELLHTLRHEGFDIWVVSGSNQWSVEAVCKRIGVPATHVIGIDLEEEAERCIPLPIQPVPVLEGKVKALFARGLLHPLVVVSDSVYDVPLFHLSLGLKVLVASNGHAESFFRTSGIPRDDGWHVIDHPTLMQAGAPHG